MQKKDVLISVGILFLLVGAVLIVMAGPSASSNDSNNPEKYALWRGGSADNVTLPLGEDRNEFTIYIKKGGEYDSISIKDSEGSELFRSDSCTNYNVNGETCQSEWLIIGHYDGSSCPCQFTLAATDDVIIEETGSGGGSDVDNGFTLWCNACISVFIGIILVIGGVRKLSNEKKEIELQQIQTTS
jgi:hypothetical protein